MPTPFASHRGPAPHVLALVLAGGEGRRLWPLTADRAKPAVPMCGRYRLIDFVLSNLVNSGLLQIKVLTQYKSDSLNTHIARGWRLPAFLDLYVEVVPAQQRTGVVVVQGLGRRDLPVAQRHHRRGAGLRRGLRRRPHVQDGRAPDDRRAHRDRRRRDGGGDPRAGRRGARVRHPRDRRPRQGRRLRREADARRRRCRGGRAGRWRRWATTCSRRSCCSRSWRATRRATRRTTSGATSCPRWWRADATSSLTTFRPNEVPGSHPNERGYWRDVGTISAYWKANMDLVKVVPDFDLYNPRWPLRTWTRPLPPAKFVFADPGDGSGHARMGIATDSLVSEGCIISGGRIDRTILSPQVRVNSFAYVEESILLDGVDIGRHCRIRRAIIDKGVHVPAEHRDRLRPRGGRAPLHRLRRNRGGAEGLPVRVSAALELRSPRQRRFSPAHASAAVRRSAQRAGDAAVGAAARRARLSRRGDAAARVRRREADGELRAVAGVAARRRWSTAPSTSGCGSPNWTRGTTPSAHSPSSASSRSTGIARCDTRPRYARAVGPARAQASASPTATCAI